MPYSFPLEESQLTAMVLGYKNADSVADILSPRVKVDTSLFTFNTVPDNEAFQIVDTRIGNGGFPNQITSSLQKNTAMTEDFALEQPITKKDLENAPTGHDPRVKAINLLAHYIDLGREKEVLDFYADATNYGSSVSAGSDTWAKAGTDIKSQIEDILGKPLMRPNTLVLSPNSWLMLRNNKSIKDAISGVAGQATMDQVKALFEIKEIIVPKMRQDTAAKGKASAIVDMHGNSVSAVYLSPQPSTDDAKSFTVTGSKDRGQFNYEDNRPGAKGAVVVKVFDERKILSTGKRSGAILKGV